MKVCSACGQNLPTTGRICSQCNIRIGRRENWFFGPDGRPRHKTCTPVAPETAQLTLQEEETVGQ